MIPKLKKFFNNQVNNVSLTFFRVLFGLVLAAEGFGAILTGWVNDVYVDTAYNFQFFGFEWLGVFHGIPMYFVFTGLGICGVMMACGYRYRLATLGYAVLWSITYLGQKSSYNNHYYLIFLLTWMSIFIPANRRFSLDVKQGRVEPSNKVPFYLNYFYVMMFAVVYFYAAKNKLYPDWLDGRFIALSTKDSFVNQIPILGGLIKQSWYPILVAWCAILYDGLVIPALVWKRTRKLAIFFSVFFHLYNSIIYQVGVFPYMSLAVLVFFVSDEWLEKWIGRGKKGSFSSKWQMSLNIFLIIFLLHFMIPLRHHLIPGNVFYTEGGHRLSWRMMLRSKSGYIKIKVVRANGDVEYVKYKKTLSSKQRRLLYKCPDVLYTYVQKIKKDYSGEDVKIYADVRVGLNGRKYKQLISPEVDLSKVQWNYFWHNDWINSYGFEE